MKITLAHALKLKKRFIGKITDLENNIRSNNVFYKENEKMPSLEQKVDISSDWNEYLKVKEQLVNLKNIIAKANAENGISEFVYRMEEKKSYISFLQKIKINANVRPDRDVVGGEVVFFEKEAQISKEDITKWIEDTKLEIECLQDKIDELNGKITIDFE